MMRDALDWTPLAYLWSELRSLDSPYCFALVDHEAAIANALRSGEVPVRARAENGFEFERIEKRLSSTSEILVFPDWANVRDGEPRSCFRHVEACRIKLLQWLSTNAIDRHTILIPDEAQDKGAAAETALRKHLSQQPELPVRTKKDVWERRLDILGDELGKDLSKNAIDRVWKSTPWSKPGRRAKASASCEAD